MTDKWTSEHWVFDPSIYEGHTPIPWLPTFSMVHKVQGWSTWINGVGGRVARAFGRRGSEAEANARLIADAPSILAEAVRLMEENKRLREVLAFIRDMPNYDQDNEHHLRAAARRALENTEEVRDGRA